MIIDDTAFFVLFFEMAAGFISTICLLVKKEIKQDRRIDGVETRVKNVENRVTALEEKIR